MNKNVGKSSTKFFVAITFLCMIIVNALANILPINGQGTGQVSDSYPNLFAPAGFTFAIWGLIYLLLAYYALYQHGFFQGDKNKVNIVLLQKMGLIFSISSIANAAWIFAWHYHLIPLSMLLMIVILICLILINQMIVRERLTKRERFFVEFPFSVYFGWITVATIANAVTLLVSLGWNGFGMTEQTWAVIIILTGMVIGLITMLRNKDIAYGFVLIWAYAGILIKHTSAGGFAGQYDLVISTVVVCLILFTIAELYLIFFRRKSAI